MTSQVKKILKAELTKICPRVYHDEADTNGAYPHIVFSLDNVMDLDESTILTNITVDIYDRVTSKTGKDLEAKADAIFNMANVYTLSDVFLLLERKYNKKIDEDNKQLRHRQIGFDGKFWKGV